MEEGGTEKGGAEAEEHGGFGEVVWNGKDRSLTLDVDTGCDALRSTANGSILMLRFGTI
jgi:hypothetical protein